MSAIAAIVGGGAILFGAGLQYFGSKEASETQANAAREASNTQLQMYNQTRADQEPWRREGQTALQSIHDGMTSGDLNRSFGMADFNKDPGYQSRMAEGQRALEGSASARGSLNSGGTLKALTRYGQDMGAQEYQSAYNRFNNDQTNRFNRLSSIAGIGQNANSQLAQAGQNAGNQISQNQLQTGNAISAGQMGQANAINNGISNGVNQWQNYQMMNRMFPTTPKTGA